jgi:hypothetical protein
MQQIPKRAEPRIKLQSVVVSAYMRKNQNPPGKNTKGTWVFKNGDQDKFLFEGYYGTACRKALEHFADRTFVFLSTESIPLK